MFLHVDREHWSDWVDAQADLSLRWAHMSFCWFCHAPAQMINHIIQILGQIFCCLNFSDFCDRFILSNFSEFVIHVVKNFGQSLHYGNQFIYQSMPRMLSLWLDFGSGVVELEKKERSRPTTTASSQGLEKLRLTLRTLNKVNCHISSRTQLNLQNDVHPVILPVEWIRRVFGDN